jgi:hypothetical protein
MDTDNQNKAYVYTHLSIEKFKSIQYYTDTGPGHILPTLGFTTYHKKIIADYYPALPIMMVELFIQNKIYSIQKVVCYEQFTSTTNPFLAEITILNIQKLHNILEQFLIANKGVISAKYIELASLDRFLIPHIYDEYGKFLVWNNPPTLIK